MSVFDEKTMSDFGAQHDNDLLYKQTLEHFGVSGDCSFEILRQCAKHLVADAPQTGVKRWHDSIIQRLVKQGDSLIDLGCGNGDLLAFLSHSCRCWMQGVESDEAKVNRCVERGLPVCHADVSDLMDLLPDENYTWAVLEDTLTTLERPLEVIRKMLRIAKHSIVTFPNFAHWSVRFTFSLGGRMPVTRSLPYKWYDTPNIHLCSISDFMDWARSEKIKIIESWALVEGQVVPFDPTCGHNITAEQSLFVIEK